MSKDKMTWEEERFLFEREAFHALPMEEQEKIPFIKRFEAQGEEERLIKKRDSIIGKLSTENTICPHCGQSMPRV